METFDTFGAHVAGVIPLDVKVVPDGYGQSLQAGGGRDPYEFVSQEIVVNGGKGAATGATYYNFTPITEFAQPNPHAVRDQGDLSDNAIVTDVATPLTPLQRELEVDMAAAWIAMAIAQAELTNPNLEYGAFIYIDSAGHVQHTPLTTGFIDANGMPAVNIDLNGISPSQIIGIVHSHPGEPYPGSLMYHFPSPAQTTADGSIKGDWAVYDYYRSQSSHGDMMRTYIYNKGQMWEYRDNDRDSLLEGAKTPTRISYYRPTGNP